MDLSPVAGTIFPRRGRRAVVVCGGPAPAREWVAAWLVPGDRLICTDGAGRPYTERLPRLPDVVVGDFDSLPAGDVPPGPRYAPDPDQHTTDAEKALRLAAVEGCADAVLLGAVGGRFDHGWYHGDLLLRLRSELPVALAGDGGLTRSLGPGERVTWDLPAGTTFSLLPQAGPCRVTVTGALYPLADAVLAPGGLVSISNRVTTPPLCITAGEPGLLVHVVWPVADGPA